MSFLSRFTTVKMDLESLVYISYLVPSGRVRQFVPRVLPLASDEGGNAYVSFVAMRCRHVRLSGIPWPRFNYDQLNLRTYVSDPQTGAPAVYFLKSGVSIGIVPLITRLMGIPWEKISLNMDASSRPIYRAWGNWLGQVDFEIGSRVGEALQEQVVRHLTGPMMGFMGGQGKLRRFRINHRSLEVHKAVLSYIRFPLPVEEGLVSETELQKPDSVLMVPEAEFTVYLPPHRVSERG
ncbi:DUF2071 domain-containing protein [Chloroflexota bacterium]